MWPHQLYRILTELWTIEYFFHLLMMYSRIVMIFVAVIACLMWWQALGINVNVYLDQKWCTKINMTVFNMLLCCYHVLIYISLQEFAIISFTHILIPVSAKTSTGYQYMHMIVLFNQLYFIVYGWFGLGFSRINYTKKKSIILCAHIGVVWGKESNHWG